ncbi:uncharacterized protein [Amphiura filiformis]|uniref:uncharacterized protein n=1 Tax=Amphiura filiformis TaxID=82378 RepID=UPI003B221F87
MKGPQMKFMVQSVFQDMERFIPIKRPTGRKNVSRPLKTLSVNLQSLKSKKEAFWEAVDSSQPDVIIANETWLKPGMFSSEMMPPGYNTPIRQDRPDGYGGVQLAKKNDLIGSQIKLETDCEIVATKVELYQQQPLVIISAYRPPRNDLPYAQFLCQAIRDIITKFPSATVWVSGDFNLPDISWPNDAIVGHQYKLSINECFLSTFQDLGLTQIVDFCTREDNILDLFLTNRPALISKCVPLPALSDHEMVLTISDVRAKRQKPVRRKLFLWKKADMSKVKSNFSDFSTNFIMINSIDTPVDNLWNQISTNMQETLVDCVPSKMSTTRFNQPWINSHLKQLARRKKRAFMKAKKTKSKNDRSRYKSLKKVEGVRNLLAKVKPFSASGPDNIPAYLLKEGANELAPALTLLFEASLHQGKIPLQWKSADVSPIFKKGDKHKPENYRPISLTSIICKLMEHILHSQIIHHLDEHGILTSKQFGFRKRHSCESQLLLTIQDLAEGLRDKEQVDAILLDFSKAFDRDPHERLLLKLHHVGVRGHLLSWIRDFLSGRTQQVVLEEAVTSNIRLFADDALLYRPIRSDHDASALQDDLARLQTWEKTWQMAFNPDKCEVLRITNKKKVVNAQYSIHGTTLRTIDEAKYLGVTIHKNLNWKPHVNNICKKANSTRGFLQRNLRKCPAKIKEQAYNAYVRPTLEFASSVWDPHPKDLVTRLDMVQRRAARFVKSDYHQRHSVTKMLEDLQWKTLYERRAHNKVIMLYRIVYGLVAIPSGPPLFIPSTVSTRGHPMQYRQQHCRILAYQHSFFPSTICLWNQLPASVVSAESLDSFRSRLNLLTLR